MGGALVLVAVAAGLVVAVRPSAEGGRIRREPADAVVDDFLAQWESWRRATLAYLETSTRRSGGTTLTSHVDVAQRFPDLVVRDRDDISARTGGRLLGCRPVGSEIECVDNGSFRPDDELRLELDGLRSLVSGNDASYRLSRRPGGCFRLVALGAPVDDHGDRERFCFDARTHALVEEERVIGDLTETVRRTELTTDVQAALLEPTYRPAG